MNIAQKAHVWSFSSHGPRGNRGVKPEDINSLGNLILVCHGCHQKIDARKDGGRYSPRLLQRMKTEHEERIERVTGIAANKNSHILLYGANIGDHGSPLSYMATASAMFPKRYPASDVPIELTTVNSAFVDRDAQFWVVESGNLQRKFEHRVRERVSIGEIDHLSVCALAPQPLLILLGTLLGDIVEVDVYQRHREPPTWEWPRTAPAPNFVITRPSSTFGPPALVLSLSATVTAERIHSVIGTDASIWTVSVRRPHNDITKSRQSLSQFRASIRPLLDEIKAVHGQTTTLHVFPAASVSVCTEFGRIRMPKADMPWKLYDQVNTRGGFISALSIPTGE